MKINEVLGEWVIMPHTAKAVGLRKTGSHWEPINHSNNRANEDDLETYYKIEVKVLPTSIRPTKRETILKIHLTR